MHNSKKTIIAGLLLGLLMTSPSPAQQGEVSDQPPRPGRRGAMSENTRKTFEWQEQVLRRLDRISSQLAGLLKEKERPRFDAEKTMPNQMTRVQLDVFQVTMTTAEMVQFDLDALVEGQPSPAQLLQKLGADRTRLAFRFDQEIDLSQEFKFLQGDRVPVVTSLNVNSKGQVTPTISYDEVGYRLRFEGCWGVVEDSPILSLTMQMDYSQVGKSAVKTANDTPLPQFTKVDADRTLSMKPGQPLYFYSTGMSGGSDGAPTEILVGRIVAEKR